VQGFGELPDPLLRQRELLRLVAAELERLAVEEGDPQRRALLLKRAMRM
jgi:hypothetical protein